MNINLPVTMKGLFLRLPIFFLIILIFSGKLAAQPAIDTAIHWKTVEETINLKATDSRPVMAFLYEPGHDTSMLMLENIFVKKELIMFANPRIFCVKVNLTDTSILWFNGKIYKKKEGEKYNDLLTEVMGNNPAIPALLFFTEDKGGTLFKGFRSRHEMRALMVYFAEGINKTTPYHIWYQSYLKTYPLINLPKALKQPIEWISLSKALKLQKSKPKDLFITWHSRLNVGSLVMLYNAFEDSVVASYMNDHFYCVRLDAQTKDTLFWNKEYVNLNRDDRFHQLALEQLEENMKFPALIFYDINKNLIIRQHSYLGSVNFYMLASYVGSGAYRTQNFQEYRKSFKVEREHTR